MQEVYITRVSAFLPNTVISNDEMVDYLGMIDGRPSRARGIVLRNNGIRQRYYALDKEGRITHTNAQLVAEAVQRLVGDGVELKDMEVLACGTSSPDQFLPSHAAQVHGLLPMPMEIISPAGACCSGMHAMKYGYLSVRSGDSRNAVTTGSELVSPMMMARNFEHETERIRQLEADPIIGFEKEFLRWMLSDGAAAALLEAQPRDPLSLRIEWIVGRSYANELGVCMYSGGDKDQDGGFHGWKTFAAEELAGKSVFSMKQDVKLLGGNIVQYGGRMLEEVLRTKALDVSSVDFFLPHLSSFFFRDRVFQELEQRGIEIPLEKWFINLVDVGNVGSASIYLMLHDLMASGRLEKGMKVLLMVPESARFSYTYALMTAV
ncbi:MAG: beta-ketoacyl-ACP synthase III [Flavobacteriales bacterium]|nr:beta-ketoacyl-ACP synthase III [Flavobacteriales bacterium]MCB9168458.1 beta-ketoacyl-ACP synthase III [Flavobacteriales bacterium]